MTDMSLFGLSCLAILRTDCPWADFVYLWEVTLDAMRFYTHGI